MEKLVFDSINIGLASPDDIRSWSYGEVTKPETINYRTLKPEPEGLFCERIFGPQKDWECHCGKYKRIRFKGKICEKCGVEITRAKVRRERMGHIELAAPVSHIWYFKGIPSRIGLMLDITPRVLERVLYFSRYIVIDPGDTPLEPMQVLDEKEYQDNRERYEDAFRAGMGAEAIRELLEKIDVDALYDELKEELDKSTGQKKIRLAKRIEVVEAFKKSDNRPEWMILDVIPVIPPDIRPMVQLDGGRFATSDLNDLYRRVINRNNRLRKLLELGAPEIIIRNEKRMLQEAVDALIDNGRRGRAVTGANNRALKSLSDMLKGKQGRFRQNLLGKRVDYSGRSVIVVGPELKIYQCGLPKEMALELFKPFVMKRLVETESASNIKAARKMVERAKPEVWDALDVVIKDHPVMLNRAPTLHRLGIQAFEPVLVEGKAIKLHPLACTAFNADFDGDQMAVHLPLSAEAQAEARFLMLAANNLLKPSDGKPVAVPTQDMIIGSYYLTMVNEKDEPGVPRIETDEDGNEHKIYRVFRDENEAIMAYQEHEQGLHAPCKVRITKEIDGVKKSELIITTVGKLIFNAPVPQDLGFVDRSKPENAFKLEVDFLVTKKTLGKIINQCIKVHGINTTAGVLDSIKAQGYKYSTRSGLTVAVSDAIIPPQKAQFLAEADERVEHISELYNRGFISDEERSKKVIKVWEDITEKVSSALSENFAAENEKRANPIFEMVDSGARGSDSQLRQLAGMRGLIANTAGKTIEVPIRSNYREGLNVIEYFISSRGARKGLADTALRTADSGYLTRRLVDVSQEVIIRDEDCGCTHGFEITNISDGSRVIESLEERLTGRYLAEPIEVDGKVIMPVDKMISADDAKRIVDAGVQSAKIRSLLTCKSKTGVCKKCYGQNLATGKDVFIGESVGIIAAQSIGEPGTQLTMRTFHTGGVASVADITQGLPRVEELFEARKPKTLAIIAEIDGVLSFDEIKKAKHAVITAPDGETKSYLIPYGARMQQDMEEGTEVRKGDALTIGSKSPADVLRVLGEDAVYNYLITEVQQTYRQQGVDINDKHIEVIVRQMMRKLKVIDQGSTNLLPGTQVDRGLFDTENEAVQARIDAGEKDLVRATAEPVLLGITKASLATDSFMSAASFQETTRVLTDAAIKGKTDNLIGLKENVIIGNLIPAGTGMECYDGVKSKTVIPVNDEDEEVDDELLRRLTN